MKQTILGYDYYSKKADAQKTVKTADDVLAYEEGLGWYVHSRKEYAKNPRKRLFGF